MTIHLPTGTFICASCADCDGDGKPCGTCGGSGWVDDDETNEEN